ncbi:MAG: hypothetical protein KAQ88_12140, partial [Hyphomicrobiaceae bacterium]|nr:hypothetical protein [Hyphomicrobiaceae bacterium]
GLKASQPNIEFVYKDMGAKKISEQLDYLGELFLTIGFQGATALAIYPDRTTPINVATVALYNEFGTQNAPARPFMRRTITDNMREIQAEAAKNFAKVAALKLSAIDAMNEIGRFVAQKMVDRIDKSPSWAIPNAESTILDKGHDHPLIGKRTLMKKSITWAVRKGGAFGSIVREGQVS